MDQDAFRNLLASGSSSHTRQSVTVDDYKRKNKKKEVESASSPAFKPRNHKKPEETYRDRATERRGGANDFADVEKVLEDFERVNANTDADLIEEQRKMLGGDEKHTVLVKGLDFALLEQQKAKLYESKDADDEMALEQVFQELSAPKKKTREELVAGLKKARSEGVVPIDKPLEIAKQQGKFKPIGVPPVTKPKKRKAKGEEKDGEKKKKKKRKVEDIAEVQDGGSNPEPKEEPLPSSSNPKARPQTPSPEIDPDADIFGDAEEYRGLPSGSDSEEEEGQEPRVKAQASTSIRVPLPPADSISRKDWFGEKPEPEAPTNPTLKPHTVCPTTLEEQHMASGPEAGQEQEEEERLRPVARLQALASSAVPSVRDILAMDEAAEREEKRKAKKEKRNKKKNPTEETKVNREVKQLEQYVATKSK